MGAREDQSILSSALFGRTRQAVLALLYTHADESYYMRQIARAVGAGQGAVQRELVQLSKAGILVREPKGVQFFYRANRNCPIFTELQGLIIKTAGVADVLRAALATLAERIDVAFIHGSMARGKAGLLSDIDLVIVGKVSFEDVVTALSPTQERLGREVNPSVYPREEFQRKLRDRHHFLTRVMGTPRIMLIGDEHDIGRLAEEHLADGA
jgi:predicted nucleotidyltransferase